jgi:sulfide:quinone oxidoreductase
VHHPYRDLVKPGVQFVQTTVRAIEPEACAVSTDAGDFDADVMVIALGAEYDFAATPGLAEVGTEFYTEAGAFAARDALEQFEGGRVIVGVTSTPFKCPPAPSETVLLVHDYLTERSLRDASEIALVVPLPLPIPPSPEASAALMTAFEERGITWHPGRAVRALDAGRSVAVLDDDSELPFDLYLGVPVHRTPAVVEASELCVDGWIPVNSLTLETSFPGVYAVGDVTSVGTPKAGVFSEGQAAVVADRIIAQHRSEAGGEYDGRGICYIEYGNNEVARVNVQFLSGHSPVGIFDAPSLGYAADKQQFGADRIRRWFGREWSNY